MKIKAIFMDMDGTLLKSDHTISEKLIAKLQELSDKGIKICIATGRPFSASVNTIKKLKMIKDPTIHYNGSMIVNPINGDILYEMSVGEKEVEEIIKISRKWNVHLNLYSNDDLYIEKESEEAKAYSKKTGLKYILDSFDNFIGKESTKALILAENKKLLEIKEFLCQKFPNLNFVFSQPTYLEILNKDANKGNAVLELLKRFHIKPEEAMAFGDQWNDFEMLKNVKYGYLMGNATEELKKHFSEDKITLSNDEDGILYILEKLGI